MTERGPVAHGLSLPRAAWSRLPADPSPARFQLPAASGFETASSQFSPVSRSSEHMALGLFLVGKGIADGKLQNQVVLLTQFV